jgi:Haemolysin-III related.
MSVSISTPSGRTMASAATVVSSTTASQNPAQAPAPPHWIAHQLSTGAAQSRYRQAKAALKAIKRQIVPVDAFGNRKPRLRGWLHVVLCGIDYSNIFLIIAGAVCFALRKPNPVPGWFEFHEVFHLGTVIGYACHVVAIYLIACAL